MLQISVPTLILDAEKAKRNIARMARKAASARCAFRPHFKTHQSVEIGEWFKEHGVDRIAVSSLRMAEKFTRAGWEDIMVAIPVNMAEIDRINELAKGVKLGLVVECDVSIVMLNRNLRHHIDLYLEVDTGYHRTGIEWDDFEGIDRSFEQIKNAELISFKGIMTHAGHTYKCVGEDRNENRRKILEIHADTMDKLRIIKERYLDEYPDMIISYGDTPSCTLADEFGPSNEIRPGNFIFYDLTMEHLGVCEVKDIAVAMACPVIGVISKRQEVAIYGGGVHFSKESLMNGERKIFGKMVQNFSWGWGDIIPDAVISGISQEHGIVKVENSVAFRRIGMGDILIFLPVHSCLTVDAMGQYLSLDGDVLNL